MLDEYEIWQNISTAFYAMDRRELFKTWRNLTDTSGGDFPVIYNKAEFDELVDRMSEEDLAKLVEKSADFNENDLYFSIFDGQLYSETYLNTYFEPIYQSRNQVYKILIEKKLTLGSKRLEEAFTEDFDEDMVAIDTELQWFFEDEPDEWKKYVEGCKKVGYDGKNGPFPMEDSDILEDYWVETDSWLIEDGDIDSDGYYTDEVSDHFNFQDDWFYWNRDTGQYCSFTDWDYGIGDEIGLDEYFQDLIDYVAQTGDDLGIAGVREILDNHRKLGYVSQKGGN